MFLGLVISVIPRKSVIFGGKSVGVAGFEPATSCSQSRRDNRAKLLEKRELICSLSSFPFNDSTTFLDFPNKY